MITVGAVCTMVGLIVGVLLRTVAEMVHDRRALPALPPPAVNVFHGTVFPDPADPRWADDGIDGHGMPRLKFGDSDILLGPLYLASCGVEIAKGIETAGRYYDAVKAARVQAKVSDALTHADVAVRAAGYSVLALRERSPDVEYIVPGGDHGAHAAAMDLAPVDPAERRAYQERALTILATRAAEDGWHMGYNAAMNDARVSAAGLLREALKWDRPDLAAKAQELWRLLYGP